MTRARACGAPPQTTRRWMTRCVVSSSRRAVGLHASWLAGGASGTPLGGLVRFVAAAPYRQAVALAWARAQGSG